MRYAIVGELDSGVVLHEGISAAGISTSIVPTE